MRLASSFMCLVLFSGFFSFSVHAETFIEPVLDAGSQDAASPPPIGIPCTEESGCPNDQRCYLGYCRWTPCHPECPKDYLCIQGYCYDQTPCADFVCTKGFVCQLDSQQQPYCKKTCGSGRICKQDEVCFQDRTCVQKDLPCDTEGQREACLLSKDHNGPCTGSKQAKGERVCDNGLWQVCKLVDTSVCSEDRTMCRGWFVCMDGAVYQTPDFTSQSSDPDQPYGGLCPAPPTAPITSPAGLAKRYECSQACGNEHQATYNPSCPYISTDCFICSHVPMRPENPLIWIFLGLGALMFRRRRLRRLL
ncbi:MAG: hypothetical protein H6727_18780 [Myxococcales bacterium]|nr:hypothetical protein [Myxococcales bacterium]